MQAAELATSCQLRKNFGLAADDFAKLPVKCVYGLIRLQHCNKNCCFEWQLESNNLCHKSLQYRPTYDTWQTK